ncbi:MAG: hypothetical protein ACM3MG_05190 [Bacillota bacterium]
MKYQNIAKATIALCTVSALAACGNAGLSAQSTVACANSSQGSRDNSSASTPTPTTPPANAYKALDMTGYVSGGLFDQAFAVDLDKVNDALIIGLPIPAGPFTQLNVDIPQLKGAKIKTYVDANGKGQVAISIPLHYVLHGVSGISPSALPNGSPLPAMTTGEAPSLAFSLNNNSENKVRLYIGVDAVGMFIESSYIPSYLGLTLPIKNKDKTKILGYFTIVPKVGTYNGGLFVALPIPNSIAKIIDDHLSGIIH